MACARDPRNLINILGARGRAFCRVPFYMCSRWLRIGASTSSIILAPS